MSTLAHLLGASQGRGSNIVLSKPLRPLMAAQVTKILAALDMFVLFSATDFWMGIEGADSIGFTFNFFYFLKQMFVSLFLGYSWQSSGFILTLCPGATPGGLGVSYVQSYPPVL